MIIRVLLIGLLFTAFSCGGEKQPTLAEITVLDRNGTPVEDARVILTCPSERDNKNLCVASDTQQTDFLGTALFEMDLPAVLLIESFKVSINQFDTGFPPKTVIVGYDSLCAEGFITLKEAETVKETVIMFDCNEL